MSADRKVPEIRFKGFSGEWLNNPIGDICSKTFGGGTPLTSDKSFWQGNIPWIQSSDLKDNCISSIIAKKYITKVAINKSATKLVSGNSIAIVTRVGVGKLALMECEYTTSQDFLSLSELKVNILYAAYVLWKQLQIEKEQAQGTSIKGITKEELLSKTINHPEFKSEQAAIGNYFQKLDTLINQYQNKHDKLCNIKKAMLEKMFPKQGETIPEIRFKGFSGKWEEKKLGEVFTYERPDNYIVKSTEYSDEYNTPVLTANKGVLLGYTNEKFTYNNPSIIFDDFTLDCKFIDFPYMVKSSAIKILTVKDSTKDDLLFAFHLLNNARIEIMGHARHYISVVQNTTVAIPKKNEQTAISNYFQKFDSLINQHQQQITKLNNIKQACLSKMFV